MGLMCQPKSRMNYGVDRANEGNGDDDDMRPRPDTIDGTLVALCVVSFLPVANDGMFSSGVLPLLGRCSGIKTGLGRIAVFCSNWVEVHFQQSFSTRE